ncbi:MAG TPA: hypothetical protein VHK68_04455, partial [Gemmatimonadales bacterium]|nr:hypothetical protein [Gemmatimonadales bacterium]
MRQVPVGLLLLLTAGCAGAPTYLRPHGIRGHRQAELGWMLLIIASLVCILVMILVVAAIYRKRAGAGPGTVEGTRGGLRWIIIGGIAAPSAILLGVLIVAMRTLRADVVPPSAALTIQVIGHRWWWEVRYPSAANGHSFTTANEIHIPTG